MAERRAPDADAPRVPIGDAAADGDEDDAPSGLPPEQQQRRTPTVDDDPESQETG